jgi:hypothetical protein
MTSVPPTAAQTRAPAAAMPPRRQGPSSGPLASQGPRALAAPRRLRAEMPRGTTAESASIAIGAASATALSSLSQRLPRRGSSSRRPVVARAAAPPSSTSGPSTPPPLSPGPEEDAWRPGDPKTPFMAERARWLERDLPHLFDDVGIDKSGYAEVVEFRDPITSVRFFQELLFFLPPL